MLALRNYFLVFFSFLLGFLIAQDASERAALLHPGVLSDGQFYSPPESVAGSYFCLVKDFSYSLYSPAYFAPFKRGKGKNIFLVFK